MTLFANSSNKAAKFLLGSVLALLAGNTLASPSVFEVGEALLPPTTANTFTRVDFVVPFAPGTSPNVFPMTTEDGADPCTIRIRNVTNTGFDAVCFEPINENRAHPGLTMEYIAVLDGVTSVPLVGGGGTVDFQSACINTNRQVYGPSCDDCSGAQSTQLVNFAPAFTSTPALLTQIQTTNNQPTGEPVFIDTSTTAVNNAGFRLSIDQLEAGTGPLPSTEEICYLAVQPNGCQQLDFSSLGGPAGIVRFNAVNGGNVDGHDNNCSAGEGATFANACFTNTPIAVAGFRTRNGNNGAVLRRCSVNASGIILTADEDQVSDGERGHIDELVSALAFSTTFTTPVTLNQASVNLFGRRALFEWQTSAEAFHLGFNLWGEHGGEWIQLNPRLIAGGAKANAGVRDYQRRVRLTQDQQDAITQFGISTVDTAGYEEFYGPFQVGESYGEAAINEPVNWQAVRAALTTKLVAQGYTQVRGRWRKASLRAQNRQTQQDYAFDKAVLNVQADGDGVQAVPLTEIFAELPQWRNQPIKNLALTLNGDIVPRYIHSTDGRLSADDTLYFAARKVTGKDAIYLRNYNYQLQLAPRLARDAQRFDGDPRLRESIASSTALVSTQLTEKRAYSAAIRGSDPWYDAQLFTTGNPASKVYSVSLHPNTVISAPAQLDISLFGSINWPGEDPDHHVQVRANGVLLEDFYFDGATQRQVLVSVPNGVLQAGENQITITLPADTGYGADIVLIDTIELITERELVEEDAITFDAMPGAQSYQVALASADAGPAVFAWQDSGALVVIENAEIAPDGSLLFSALVDFPGTHYAVGNAAKVVQDLSVSLPVVLHELNADLLVVAHPSLMVEELSVYIEGKRDEGLRVEMVDWLEIVETYGHGNNTAAALDKFLKLSNAFAPLDNLLIVGGHSWDYIDISGQGTVNLIPTHYRPIGIFGHAPSDNVYADLDGDNRPELSIGRWPARDENDLSTVIAKTKKWQQKVYNEQYMDALLLTQQPDSRGLNFDSQMQGRVSLPLSQTDWLGNTSVVSMQAIAEQGMGDAVAVARQQLSEAINTGTDLLSFAGHASSSSWGFQSIVNTDFIRSLNNVDDPVLVMPLACYTTYYESPSINTLAHQWLFAGPQGAAAVHGASVLGEYRENGVFAERFLRASDTHKTLGGAIRAAKREMSSQNPMLNNWALLGDPTLPLH